MKDVISKYSRQIPSNSQMQLSDFINKIEEVLGMTKYQEDLNEKKELYFEYKEAIETVNETVKKLCRKGDVKESNYLPTFAYEKWHFDLLTNIQ